MNTIITNIQTIVALITAIYAVLKVVNSHVHNKNVDTLTKRAGIIVGAITDISKDDELTSAISELENFAKETHIKLTSKQAETYIKSAMNLLKGAK